MTAPEPSRSIYEDLEPRRSFTPLVYTLTAVVGITIIYVLGGTTDAMIVIAAGVTMALASMLR